MARPKKPALSEIAKLEETMDQERVSSLRGMQTKELELELNKAAKLREGYISLKNEDVELRDAKEHVKSIAAPHNEDIRSAARLQRFIALLLTERGQVEAKPE